MRYKSLLLAGAMAVSIAAGALHHSAHATNSGEGAFVVAQNSDKPGFFDRIFNRSNNRSAAKPLFLNDRASSSGVKPYDFRQAQRNRQSAHGSVSWEAFDRKRQEHALQVAAQAAAAADRMQQETDRFVQMQLAAAKRNKGSASAGDTQPKKMVYEPNRAWSYDPNKRQGSSREAPRIYNTNR